MLEHKGTIDIKTDRLLLRKFQISDAEEIFATWTSDERVAKYTSWYAHQSVEDTMAYVGYMASKNEMSDYNWIIESAIGIVNKI